MEYILYKDIKIEYTLSRKSKKNINLRIKEDGHLYVSAPKRATKKEIERAILEKGSWIVKTSEKMKRKSPFLNRYEIENENKFWYNGILYSIEKNISNKNEVFRLGDKIIINLKENTKQNIEKILNKWRYSEAKNIFDGIIDRYINILDEYDIKKPEVQIRNMSSRWGSCIPSKNKIILNVNLIHTPLSCIEYIVLHELVHFIEPNHSKGFYSIIEDKMPDWKVRKNMLK